MPPPDPAKPTLLSTILDTSTPDQKVRIAARILSYDPSTGLLLLNDSSGENAVLVQAEACIDPLDCAWMRERGAVVMVMGYLEHSATELIVPILPPYAPLPVSVSTRVALRAILVRPVPDLDLRTWEAGARALEEFAVMQGHAS